MNKLRLPQTCRLRPEPTPCSKSTGIGPPRHAGVHNVAGDESDIA
jgi:hypothetical protein